MADTFGNLIKIWGGVSEPAVDIAARLQDGMLAYCPFEKVAVWRRDESYFETLASEARVLELIDANPIPPVNQIDFIPQLSEPLGGEGTEWFDDFAQTMKVKNDKGIDIQMGRTISSRFTAEENILKGQTLYASNLVSAGVYGVKLALADSYNENWVVGMAGNDALTGEICEFIQQGFIHGVDTSLLTESVPLYFDIVRGGITNTRPDFPAEPIIIGAVLLKDASNGIIGVNMNRDTYDHSYDGCIIERQNSNIVVDGTSVYIDVTNLEHPLHDLPVQLSSETIELNCTTGTGAGGSARVELVQGTTTMTQDQVVYIDLTGGVATLKVTTGYPSVPFCIVADVSIRDYVSVGLYGADAHRRATSAVWHDGRGRQSYIAERFAIMPPEYRSGVIPTATLDQGQTPDSMNLSVIAGIVYQTHRQSFPALSVDTDGVFVANGSGGTGLDNYSYHTDLTTLTGWTSFDVARDTTCTGNLVIFGVINKSSQECKLYCNLPSKLRGTSTANGKSIYDNADNEAVLTSPSELNTVSFLIARIPYRLTSSGNTLTFLDPDGNATTDGSFVISLLGQQMGSSGGGVGGGSAGIQNLTQVLTEGNSAGNIGITDLGDTEMSGDIGRTAHNSGALIGGFNNIGDSTAQSSPIYSMGSAFKPNLTDLANMYGIGYTNSLASFVDLSNESWGFYVAGAGVASAFISGTAGGKSYINSDFSIKGNKLENVGAGTTSADGVNLGQVNTIVGRTSGSFTATLTGVTTTVTGTAYWQKVDNVVTLEVPTMQGTSNSVEATITGLPSEIQNTTLISSCGIMLHTGAISSGIQAGFAWVKNDGAIQLNVFDGTGISFVGFNPTGNLKGIPYKTTLTYTVD